jgi:hypothetical protein
MRWASAVVAALALAGCGAPHPVSSQSGVLWVPTCENDPLEIDGTTWYPADVTAVTRDAEGKITPGSGQGTFVAYSDGTAYWTSLDGAFHGRLTTDGADFESACGAAR